MVSEAPSLVSMTLDEFCAAQILAGEVREAAHSSHVVDEVSCKQKREEIYSAGKSPEVREKRASARLVQ